MAGFLLLGSSVSSFNGGRSQGQSSFIGFGGDFPFMNLLLGAQGWAFSDNSGWPAPNTLQANGLPLNSAMTNNGVSTVFQIPTQTERSGNYVVITTGTGDIIGTGLSLTSVSGTNTQTVVSGAALGSNTQVNFRISATDAATPISKIAFVHSSDVAAYLADNYAFGLKYLSIVRQAKWGVIRFLNWQNGNFTNETNWASRTPMDNWSYYAGQFPAQRTDTGLGCQVGWLGQTTSVLNDYSISDSVGTAPPVHGQTILLNYDEISVTVTNGANAQITFPSPHNLQTGMPFSLFYQVGGSAPGGVTVYPDPLTGTGGPSVFYAIFISATVIRFATTYANAIAGTAITTSSTGSLVTAHSQVVEASATINVGSNLVNWPHHFVSTGDPVCMMNNITGNVANSINYWAIVIDADNIRLASSRANALASTPITITGSGGACSFVRQPTLNLNGTGAVPIRLSNMAGMTIGSNGTPTPRIYADHKTYGALTYDSVLGVWVQNGACQGAGGPIGIASNVPPEICLKLCREVGAHPYFVSGYMMLDPLTDYMPSLMQYLKDNGPSWMIPRIEVYNEPWNGITAGPPSFQYKSWANWGVLEFPGFNTIGKFTSVLGQAANVVWPGGKGTKYHILVGVQTAIYTSAPNAAATDDLLTASQYVAQAASPQSPYLKDPAYKWASHIAVAQYVTPSIYDTATEITMANNWVAGGSLPNDALLTQYVDSLAGAASGFNLAATNLNYTTIWTWAQGAGVSGGWGGLYKLGMAGYEGGYSPSLFGSYGADTAAVYNFRVASKYVADVGKGLTGGTFADASVVNGTYNDFTAAGGIFPSCFQLAGGSGAGVGALSNAWSVLDPNIYLTPQPSQWTAIVAYNP